ncbi:hypothetical protein K1719_020180 [Acacia pycnantha]|nr:hypothetical protein K1719_020180 [Acacia pycnantha]
MELSLLTTTKVPLSKEENDLLNRSAKKIKNGEDNEWPKLGTEGMNKKVPGTSFVEKLKGTSQDESMVEDNVNIFNLSDDSISEDDDNEPDCKVVTKKLAAGPQVGGEATKASMEQGMGAQDVGVGQEASGAEEWKVVQRSRRQKKPNKEPKTGDVRRKEEGSRYGVLAEEGNGCGEEIVTDQVAAVRVVAAETNPPAFPTSAHQFRGKKVETKKKIRKEHLQVREKGVKKQSKQEMKKEKRARDVVQSEKQGEKSLMGTIGEEDVRPEEGTGVESNIERKARDDRSAVGPIEEKPSAHFENPPDPEAPQLDDSLLESCGAPPIIGPVGKFWASPLIGDEGMGSELDPGVGHELDKPSDEFMETVVPDTRP